MSEDTKEKILKFFSNLTTILIGLITFIISIIEIFFSDYSFLTNTNLREPTLITLSIVSILAIAIGLERWHDFGKIHKRLDSIDSGVDSHISFSGEKFKHLELILFTNKLNELILLGQKSLRKNKQDVGEYVDDIISSYLEINNQGSITILDTAYLFRHYYVKALYKYRDATFIATSLPYQQYFWRNDKMEIEIEKFLNDGGNMKRIFFLEKEQEDDKTEIEQILNYQWLIGIEVYTAVAEDIPSGHDLLFFADTKGRLGWEAGMRGKNISEINMTVNTDTINRYNHIFNSLISNNYAKLFKPANNLKMINLGDVTISYVQTGKHKNKPNLIFIGGWRMSKKWWHKQYSLGEHFNCYFLDMRGYGYSSKKEEGNTLKQHATDILNFISMLGLNNVTLVGWSLGASTIFSFFEQFNDNNIIEKIVIVDQTPKILSDDIWKYGLGTGEFSENEMFDFLKQVDDDDKNFVESFVPTMFVEEYRATLTKAEVMWMCQSILEMPTKQATSLLLDHMKKDWRDVIKKIHADCLIISGKESTVFPYESSEYLHSCIKKSRLVIYDKCGHLPFYEHAERFNNDIIDFHHS